MTRPAHPLVGTPFAENRFVRILVGAYAAAWCVAAVAPLDRRTWLLENGLVVLAWIVLVCMHRRLVLSRVSCALLFVFGLLHVVGAHYTYSAVPLGDWVAESLGTGRNHYDRFVHLCFGLLLAYPTREIVLRVLHVRRFGSYALPVISILAMSAFYEMIESWAARLVAPGVGMAFVGAQGDVWDGQKDMSLAFGGAVLAMALTAVARRCIGFEPYLALEPRGRPEHA